MTGITSMKQHHAAQAASLHIQNLNTDFKGKSGVRLLESYYRSVAASAGATGFVAEIDDKTVGYICGVWDAGLVRKELIRRYWGRLIGGFCWQIFENPKILASLLDRIAGHSEVDDYRIEGGCELRPIVVSPSVRGKGIADKLFTALLEEAGQKGFTNIYLISEVDNKAANRFYVKSGFELAGSCSRDQQIYNIFRISTQLSSGIIDER